MNPLQKMYLIGIILVSALFCTGCFTSMVRSMQYPEPVPEKIVKIENAALSENGTVCISLITKQKHKTSNNYYKIELNIDSLVQIYQPRLNHDSILQYSNISRSDESLFPDSAELEKNRITGITYIHDTANYYYIYYISNNFHQKNAATYLCNSRGNDITNQISTYINPDITGYQITDQVACAYNPIQKPYNSVILVVSNSTRSKKWPAILYPFAFVGDVVTFPLQFIGIIIIFRKSL